MPNRIMRRLVAAFALVSALVLISPVSVGAAPQTCGGLFFHPCQNGSQFCQFPPPSCGFGDIQGVCTRVPLFCNKIFRPVCGCDGRTYGNDCQRQSARVSKRHNGRCKTAT